MTGGRPCRPARDGIIRIGNSRGVRIPKPLLAKAGLEEQAAAALRDSGDTGLLDELRAVARGRLVKRLGRIPPATLSKVLGVLQEMFAE